MTRLSAQRDRLSIDVPPDVHKKIKIYAAINDKTIRDYVLEILEEQLRLEEDVRQLDAMTANIGPVFEELWDNEKDASYDDY